MWGAESGVNGGTRAAPVGSSRAARRAAAAPRPPPHLAIAPSWMQDRSIGSSATCEACAAMKRSHSATRPPIIKNSELIRSETQLPTSSRGTAGPGCGPPPALRTYCISHSKTCTSQCTEMSSSSAREEERYALK